jgi:c-di-GMP-binding flagellar brake protein YcgR
VDEKRRDIRYPARIVASMVRRNETLELLTNDVSYRGAFIRTDTPPTLRQLLRVTFTLPNGGAKVAAHGMVVRVVTKGEGGEASRVPGVGLQFWGPIDQAKAWDQFIYDLKMREKAGMPNARATDKVRRSSERFKLALDVQLGSETMTTRDVSETGMAIVTNSTLPVGARTTLQIRRGRESIVIDVIVRRRIEEKDFVGLGVEYVDVPPTARESIIELVRSSAPDEDVIIVDPNDPGLH